HAAFKARLKGYVYNGSSYVQVFNRYGYDTSANFDVVSLGYAAAMIAAMNSVSPRAFKLELYTQFNDGTGDYIDIGGLNDSDIITGGTTKTFVTLSTVAIGNFELLPIDMTVPFTLTTHGSYAHTVRLYCKNPAGTAFLIKTVSLSAGVTSGNFAIGTTERNIILNALPTVAYATTYAEVDTASYGTTNSKSVATTLTLHADFKPTIGTVTHAESSLTQFVKTALGYGAGTPFYLTAKSKTTFTVPVTNATGATTSSIRVVFAGTDKSQAASPIITDFLSMGGTPTAVITVTDSRGRVASVVTAAITVRAYTYPKVDKFEVYRSNSGGTYDPSLGTYLRCVIKGTAYTVKALDGTTEKNWIKYKIDYRVKNTGGFSNNTAVVPGGLVFGELTTAALAGFLTGSAYDVRIRVFDAFYDLDSDASALEDTDDYAEGLTILPIAKITSAFGDDWMSIGMIGDGTYAIDSSAKGINTLGDFTKSGVKIVESGSNANGSYIKFSDGVMICYSPNFAVTHNGGAVAGWTYISPATVWTFPVAFYATPNIVVASSNYAMGLWTSASTTSVSMRSVAMDSTGRSSGLTGIAVGRWKA
ncbi:MAG: hypothetical protein WBL80_06780, partial [Erysipelotrichaceae bacterium]